VIPCSLFAGASFAEQAADTQATSSQDSTQRTANATLSNMLPADGCSYPVTIGSTDYAPDTASREVMAELVPGGSTMRARISYNLTGATGTVECGFGVTMVLPEISFQIMSIQE
jgi:hypothetical protein